MNLFYNDLMFLNQIHLDLDVYKRQGQELEDHYFGSLKRKVAAFMKDLAAELWKYGLPSKTKHNEVAPAPVSYTHLIF